MIAELTTLAAFVVLVFMLVQLRRQYRCSRSRWFNGLLWAEEEMRQTSLANVEDQIMDFEHGFDRGALDYIDYRQNILE